MNIAILGTGRVGSVLGRRWSEQGHDIFFGSRNPTMDKVQKMVGNMNGRARAADIRIAAASANVVVLAVPWPAVRTIVEAAGDLKGKTLIDCTNPLNDQLNGLELGFTTSASEQISQWAAGAQVVKAFNTVSAATIAHPVFQGQSATMFYCGDFRHSKAIVHQLTEAVGLEPIDAGSLQIARYLEPLAMLYIHLANQPGWGADCAFKFMKR